MYVEHSADLVLHRVEDALEGTVAYAVERAGVPLGLLVSYVDDAPSAWWGYARYTAEARLAPVARTPFTDAQAAVDAVERAISQHPAEAVPA